jgi:hypothetical protein
LNVSEYVETVIVTVVTAERLPSVAVTVAVYVPAGTELVAAIVATLVIESSFGSMVAEDGEKVTVRPVGAVPPALGTIETESVTLPCSPPPGVTITVGVTLAPPATTLAVGFVLSLSDGVATVKLIGVPDFVPPASFP